MTPTEQIQPSLSLLGSGRWISSGRRLNYESWSEGELFVELDALITKSRRDPDDRLLLRVMDLQSLGIPPARIAQRLLIKCNVVLEILGDIRSFGEDERRPEG